MSVDFIIVLCLLAVSAASLQTLRLRYFQRKLRKAGDVLRDAKREVMEISQLPVGNPQPLIQISQEGEIVFANPAALESFPDLKQLSLEHPVLQGLPDSVCVGEESVQEVQWGDRYYQRTVALSRVQDNDTYIVYCYDITDRKAYELELQKARETAEKEKQAADHAKKARGDFLANMSHELRTPMNGIIGLSDILVDAGLKDDEHELIVAVNSSARNLLTLLNDILDFSKIEAGELTMESIPFALADVTRQVEVLQSQTAVRKNVALETIIESHVPPYVIGDPSRLQQVLNNLVGNALKFTDEGSVTVSIGGEQSGEGRFLLRIDVADTGIGIPADKQEAVFAKFQQADSSTSRKYGGTGLGLAITKDIITLMGGTVSLRSEEGKGSVFTVNLPAKISDAASVEREGKSGQAQGGLSVNKAAKIMVVDDHPVNLLYMRRILGKIGFENLDEASSGAQALTLFEANDYDLIFMDCQMPDMDGFETARQIRVLESAETEPAIIAVTADAMKGAEQKCLEAGMDDYISKPVNKRKLLSVLQQWVPGDDSIEQKSAAADSARIQENQFIDWAHLNEFTGGDKQTESDIIEIFLGSLDTDIQEMEKHFVGGDYKEWDNIVHKICGSSAHLGARDLSNICDRAQTETMGDKDKMAAFHARILDAYKNVCDYLSAR